MAIRTTKSKAVRSAGDRDGNLWRIRANGDWMAIGTGGQKVIIDPARQLVLINRVDTGEGMERALWFSFGPRMTNTHMRELKDLILSAAPDGKQSLADEKVVLAGIFQVHNIRQWYDSGGKANG